MTLVMLRSGAGQVDGARAHGASRIGDGRAGPFNRVPRGGILEKADAITPGRARVEDRDEAPHDALPTEPQDAPSDAAGTDDELPGAIAQRQVTVWMYPICPRIEAASAALTAGAVIGSAASIWFDHVWGPTALMWSLSGTAVLTAYLYVVSRAGWVDVSADRLKVQDTLASRQRTFVRGEISSVVLQDGRMSISGADGFPRWRRLRPSQERKLREQLERYCWIEPGDTGTH